MQKMVANGVLMSRLIGLLSLFLVVVAAMACSSAGGGITVIGGGVGSGGDDSNSNVQGTLVLENASSEGTPGFKLSSLDKAVTEVETSEGNLEEVPLSQVLGISVVTTVDLSEDVSSIDPQFFVNEDFVGAVGDTDWTSGWRKSGASGASIGYDLDGLSESDLAFGSDNDLNNWDDVDVDGDGVYVHKSSSNIRLLSGIYTSDLVLDNVYEYVLSGFVSIESGANITIPAGTVIRGLDETEVKGVLVIKRGAKIFSMGTKNDPVVFTSANPINALSQDWGGLVICGKARVNLANGEGSPEGVPDTIYGGDDDGDSSGKILYTRVEYGGWQINSNTELNGVAFYAVGSGTEVDYLQVHRNSDDGVEFFGGKVNVKHLLITGCEDDSIDWTEGYRGKIQYAIVQQYEDFGDRGIEADNNSSDPNAEPRSSPILSNITLIGSSSGDTGVVLRAGTEVQMYNSIVLNWNNVGLDRDDSEGTPYSGLQVRSNLFVNNINAESEDDGNDNDLISGNNNRLIQ
jgi:hypothetical protein